MGLGRRLVEAVAAQAKARGAPVVHWKTRESNAAGLALYTKFAQRTEFVSFRLAL
jgi:ribosomal protein S18 acetylase RimI-like enzyme